MSNDNNEVRIGSNSLVFSPGLYRWSQAMPRRLQRIDLWTAGMPELPAWALAELCKKGSGSVVCDDGAGVVIITKPEEVPMT